MFIGIAGGSGAGKTTASLMISDKYPDQITVIHLDDYSKKLNEVPMFCGIRNCDHPDAFDFKRLLDSLKTLQRGNPLSISTQDKRIKKQRIPFSRIYPKKIIILDGFLILWHPQIRKLLKYAIYLDADLDTRIKRRTKFKNKLYIEKILVPMHQQYVNPTKQYADYIINTAKLSKVHVFKRIEKLLKNKLKWHLF